jgi:hypothetical protein
MKKLALALALAGLLSCGKGEAPKGRHAPITGTLQLHVSADPEFGSSFWAVLRRDGADEFQVESVRAGTRSALSWKEEVSQPRTWRLKFGPSRHPTYQLLLLPGGGSKPEVRVADLGSYHDPRKSLAIAYFAIPLDGERELNVTLKKPDPVEASVLDSSGAPLPGVRVVGIATPRYLFLDGFDAERVDAMQLSWSWDFWNFDHVPAIKIPPERIVTAKTDDKGVCRLDGFLGWVGVSERDERFVQPRSVLAMAEQRSLQFAVVRNPASVRLTVEGLPGRDYTITERGLFVEGEWPLPAGFKPARWSDKLSFLQGKTAEFFTPCREVRVRPMSPVHKVAEGGVAKELGPGESRKHRVLVQELEHKTIEGEAVFEESDRLSREHCGLELYDAGGRLLRSAGSLGGPGVPKSGRVPFAFHVLDEGPYTLLVRTGSYASVVLRDVKAPKEELIVRLSLDRKNVPCTVTVREKDGSEAAGAIVGTWPHRDLVSDFISGAHPSGKPGLNTFIVSAESGSAVLRDVPLEEGKSPKLEATLSPGTTVRGRLVDGDGRPIAGQWVHLSWPGYYRMASAFRWLSDLTGEDGRFEIPRVPAGPWRIYGRGSGAPAGEPFTVPEGGATWDAGDLKLSGAKTIGDRAADR